MFEYKNIMEFERPYIIAEAGANHNGDMDLAFRMIEEAKNCGADCIKFQSWSKASVFSKKVYNDNFFLQDDYRNRNDFTLEQIVEAYSIDREKHKILKQYCDKVGIDFNSTPFSKEEVNMLVNELDVPFIKIASMDLDNIPFLKYIATLRKPVVISTGLCGLSEVNDAVECLNNNGCNEVILLHCVSIYPPENSQVNLNNIDTLRNTFGCKVGYSDHTLGTIAPIMSIAKGVCVIEKHFTLDKTLEGWDHKISANPKELREIVNAAYEGYQMLGSRQKYVVESTERRDAFKRSIVASKEIKKGEVITEEHLDYKRPGSGISPKYYEFIVGKVAKKDIQFDEMLTMEDF